MTTHIKISLDCNSYQDLFRLQLKFKFTYQVINGPYAMGRVKLTQLQTLKNQFDHLDMNFLRFLFFIYNNGRKIFILNVTLHMNLFSPTFPIYPFVHGFVHLHVGI